MGNTTHFSTKERILGAAEELFAQHGFAGTSLRQVTSPYLRSMARWRETVG